jgi:hypothetical protein
MVTDLERWAKQCEALHQSLHGEAVLDSYEPGLRVTLRTTDTLGHLSMLVAITPDHLNQRHTFEFELDQSYLPQLIHSCREIIATYPVVVWRTLEPINEIA